MKEIARRQGLAITFIREENLYEFGQALGHGDDRNLVHERGKRKRDTHIHCVCVSA